MDYGTLTPGQVAEVEARLAREAKVDALIARAKNPKDWYSGNHKDDEERLSEWGRN